MSETTWTQDAGMSSPTEADNVENYSEQAEASKDAAAASATAAATSATSASGSASTASTKAAEAAASATASASSATQSASSATSAASSATTAGSAQTAAETAKTGAETAQTAAETAKAAAETAQTAAETAETNAETAETNASTSATAAATSATAAAGSATSASTSATNAATSATASETSKVAAVAAQAAAETAKTGAETAQTAAETAETNAETAESNASASATAAAASATAASSSASGASTSATEAASSETAASNSATAASGSASTAASEATAAAGSATAASASASSASAAQTAAETAETNAETAETNAETAQTAAETAETNAATSATTATTQATTATTKAGEASASATAAAASEAAASSSETSAAASATTATTQATNASTSATASEASKVAAVAAQAAAETAETNAETAQAAAETAETNAAASETAAATSETNAATSASTATTQAGISTTKAGEASASATSAAASATSASASKDAALAALDSFDDRYLGQKSADPTVDNDGDALVAGSLYFNTTTDSMMVYEGSAWVAAYASLSGALLAASNLSDVADAAAARTNLGLVIGTNVQAFSAVLAATTASYTTAEETKLAGIEANATADQTAAQIKTAYESNADTNEFSDAEQTKLAGIEASADVTDTANVVAALTAGTNVTIAANGTISSTDTNTVYTHPTHPGDDFSVDTGALTGATVVSDIDINVTTDGLGHVTDANGSVATRTLTLANLGYTGATNANNYVHPTHPGDDLSIDTGALSGATVISDLDINVTTDGLGHVTDANATVATRTLTLADLGYTGATNANYITNNNQLTNGAGYTTNVGDITGVTAGSGISGGGTSGTVTISHADTSSQGSVDNSGATVIQDVTLDTYGHVTGLGSHTLTLANLGYTGATNANYITNNNQLTNGAGYITSSGSITGNAGSVDGYSVSTTRDAANTIPVRNASGYLDLGWINTTSGDTSSSLSRVYVDTGDNYIRKCTLAHLASQGGFAGDITNVSAGTNLTGGGSSGSVTLNVTASPTFTTVTAATFNTTSDRNTKTDITPISDAVSKVQQLGGYSFTFKDSGEKSSGVIAQEVQAVLPELVQEADAGHLTVQYGNMVGLLIEAIKEQQAQIDALTAKLNG